MKSLYNHSTIWLNVIKFTPFRCDGFFRFRESAYSNPCFLTEDTCWQPWQAFLAKSLQSKMLQFLVWFPWWMLLFSSSCYRGSHQLFFFFFIHWRASSRKKKRVSRHCTSDIFVGTSPVMRFTFGCKLAVACYCLCLSDKCILGLTGLKYMWYGKLLCLAYLSRLHRKSFALFPAFILEEISSFKVSDEGLFDSIH